MDRRHFLTTAAAGSVALAAASVLPGCGASTKSGKKQAKSPDLKISFQEWIAPGDTLGERLDFMESLGVTGFEPGGKGLSSRISEIRGALEGRNIKVSAICAGFDGFILAEDAAVKELFDKTYREILAAAGELGSVGVIMVPAFNSQTPCRPHTLQTRDFLCEELFKLGEYAAEHGMGWPMDSADYFSAHGYIRPQRAFKFGVFWPFYMQPAKDRGAVSGGSSGGRRPGSEGGAPPAGR